MRIAVFSTKRYDRTFLEAANDGRHEITFFEPRLGAETAPLADGHDVVCAFVNDSLDEPVLEQLAKGGVRLIALRSAGFNHVDIRAADRLGIAVVRVPAYSPHAVAEHAVALMLTLNRRTHRAWARVREGNFSLEGLMGWDLAGQTVGIVGTGQIGAVLLRIMAGFGCKLLATDPYPRTDLDIDFEYVSVEELFASSDIVSLHCPLTPETLHLVDADMLARMRPGAMLINTSRGGLVDAEAAIDALKSGQLGHLGLDVYEEEEDLFFQDLSERVITDDTFMRLLTFPNVLVTGHQAFFTREAVENIAATTIHNVTAFEDDGSLPNRVTVTMVS